MHSYPVLDEMFAAEHSETPEPNLPSLVAYVRRPNSYAACPRKIRMTHKRNKSAKAVQPASLCADCGQDTTPCTGERGCRHKGRWEYYMVHDAIWAAAGMSRERKMFLC